MRIEVRETKIYRTEIDPMDVVRAYPVEWLDFLGDDAQTGGWDEDDVREFISESLHECGRDLFLEIDCTIETDDELEIEIR